MCRCGRLSSVVLLFVLISSGLHSVAKESQGFVDVKNAQLYYMMVGSGEPIVVVHGGPGLDHTYLLPQMNSLATNRQLIYYDQRGTGKSSGTVDSISITPDQFVEDLEGLRNALGIEKMNLLGHSWGGLLAMEYAIKYPQHMKSLILMNSVGASSDFMTPFIKTRIERTTHEDSLSLAAVQSSPGFAAQDPETIGTYMRTVFKTYFFDRRFADSLRIQFNQNTSSHFFPIFALMGKHLAQYNLYKQLAAIQCPTLIIHGDFDPIPAEFSTMISQHIRNSQLLLIRHCGHFPFIEKPDEVARACRTFWDGLPH